MFCIGLKCGSQPEGMMGQGTIVYNLFYKIKLKRRRHLVKDIFVNVDI